MTKAEQAVAIYKEEKAKGTEDLRNVCIERFKAELQMTQSGATTYWHNSKKKAEGGVVKSYYKGRETTDPSTDTPDKRTMYSIVNEVDGKVDSTDSGYCLKTLRQQSKGRIIVKGLPDLDKPVNKLKAI
ncbi:MAG: hypothetical protein JXR12_06640 [Neptunomonas phycophila]|uniref:hypothetical protein n=1 Tax=Neptunomonas phycophila TaxID=1572645 RepID=UPI003B8B4ECD